VTLDQVRKFALSLPEATEEPHFEATSFRVKGKIFATAPPDSGYVNVMVDEHETRACVAEAPDVFEEVWWGQKLAAVRVHLKAAKAARVRELLEDAWRRKAPKKLAAKFN